MPKCLSPSFYGRCRKCEACLKTRLRSWVFRMMLEAMLYPPNYTTFLTLTYRNSDLPGDDDQAKEQLQKFFKRVRREMMGESGKGKSGLRYVAGLEKGTKGTCRYHWHIILYGFPIGLVNKHFLAKKWTHGFIDWLPSNPRRMSYVCKYAIKGGLFLMSRRPGIGDGMIDILNKTIDGLSQEELKKVRDRSSRNYLINKYLMAKSPILEKETVVVVNPYASVARTVSGFKIGGYYFPLHDFLKKRLRDLRKKS